ncbi:MAG: hypothetical protein RL220_1702 [Bacteroidota bacterium]
MKSWLIFSLLILAFSSCAPASGDSIQPCQGTLITGKYARGFQVWLCDDHTTVQVNFRTASGDTTLQMELLKKPDEAWPCATLSTTHLDFLEQLGLIDFVKATGAAEYTHNATARQKLMSGEMTDLSSSDSVDPEKLMTSGSKLYFSYPFAPDAGIIKKAPGVTSIPVAEYLESHPLARMEWIRFFGAIMGRMSEADSIFQEAERLYLSQAEYVRNHLADSSRKEVLAFSVYHDQWSLPPGNSFLAQLTFDAGGKYLLRDRHSSGNINPDKEELYLLMQKAEILLAIMPDGSTSTAESLAGAYPEIRESKAWKTGRIYICDTKASDYFGKAILEPHILLSDLMSAFHGYGEGSGMPVYFKPSAK